MPKMEDFVGYFGHYFSPVKSIMRREETTVLGLSIVLIVFLLSKAITLGINGFTFYGDVSLPALDIPIILILLAITLLFFSILSYRPIEALAFVVGLLMLSLLYSFYNLPEAFVLLTIYSSFYYTRQKSRKKAIWRE